MIEIKTAERSDLGKIAKYMSQMNSTDENRCAFIDCDESETQDYLKEIYDDSCKSVIFIEENSNILGAAAGDICDDNNTIEVIGPFINKEVSEYGKYLKQMIFMMKELNKGYRLKFFIDKENELIRQFIISNNGMITGSHCNMEFKQSEFIEEENDNDALCVDYTRSLQDDNIKHQIEKLHDSIFASAYYNSDTVMKNINQSNILSCCIVDSKVVSYAFYNTENDGYIDFIGTDKDERCKGYGQLLLNHVLGNIKRKKCDIVRLCVNADNDSAISLYNKTGFKITEENEVYSL